ncbi:MAG: RNA polymerase sigma-54 factor [Lentisphaerae bacterium]|nr:MAG: RNA polymerase sigma-54 factor [Lentisphaerota bacterium]
MAMDMQQKQQLSPEMRQEQIMTHQQIQALELLAVPVLELGPMVTEEIQNNPLLDTEGEPDESIPAEADDEEWLELVLKLDESRRCLNTQRHHSSHEEENKEFLINSISYQPSLIEDLEQQLHFIDLEPHIQKLCELVISALDDDGFLRSHAADLAMAGGCSLTDIEQAIKIVQTLDPPGIAARDLRERLLLQLQRQQLEDSLAYTIVHDHFDELGANHLPQLAKKLKLPLDEIRSAIHVIQNLSPRLNLGTVNPYEYIEEEVTVEEQNGEFHVIMNNSYLPPLYLNRQYREMLLQESCPKDVKNYLKEKIRSGLFLINSIIQRQTTIQKIASCIVEMQEDFFRFGPTYLKPLTMAQVAAKAGVHETTVSRAVAGKFLKCRFGLIPMRKFFTSGFEDESGQSISNTVVKNTIREIINAEDPYNPLSDSQIARELKRRGYPIARRTVAKYRETLGILPSNLRRKY